MWERSNTEKTLEKITAAMDLVSSGEATTYRQQAAIFGILFFAESVAPLRGTGLADYFDALNHLRTDIASTSRWNAKAPLLRFEVARQLLSWCGAAQRNQPTLFKAPGQSDHIDLDIYVDASAKGWGAVARSSTGCKAHGATWSDEDHQLWNLHSSVAAEPLAFRRAVCAAFSTIDSPQRIRVHVDHHSLVFAFERGHSRVRAYNEAVKAVKEALPASCSIEVCFVAGRHNTDADAISRNSTLLREWQTTKG
jgi:hypothetical protein